MLVRVLSISKKKTVFPAAFKIRHQTRVEVGLHHEEWFVYFIETKFGGARQLLWTKRVVYPFKEIPDKWMNFQLCKSCSNCCSYLLYYNIYTYLIFRANMKSENVLQALIFSVFLFLFVFFPSFNKNPSVLLPWPALLLAAPRSVRGQQCRLVPSLCADGAACL